MALPVAPVATGGGLGIGGALGSIFPPAAIFTGLYGLFGGGNIPGGYPTWRDYLMDLHKAGGDPSKMGGFLPTGGLGANTGINWGQILQSGLGALGPILSTIMGPGGTQPGTAALDRITLSDVLGSSRTTTPEEQMELFRRLGIGPPEGAAEGSGSWFGDFMKNWGNPLGQLANLGLGIYGGFGAQHQQDWTNAAKVNVLDYLRQLSGTMAGQYDAISGQTLPYMLDTMRQRGEQSTGYNDMLSAGLGQGLHNLGMFREVLDPSTIPGLEAALGTTGIASQAGQAALLPLLQNLMQGAGPAADYGLGRAQEIAGGQGWEMGLPAAVGGDLLSARGQDPYTQLLQQFGGQTLARGGYTPALEGVTQFGQTMAGPQADTNLARARAMSILAGNPLLPLDQVVSMARNRSATQSRNQESATRRQLLNRTGVTGPAVASGQQGELLQNLGDEALDAEARAVQEAMLGQQALGLQQFGQGIDLFGRGAGQALTGQQAGIDAILRAAGQAAGREQSLPQLGLGGAGLELNRLTQGGNLLGQFTDDRLGGLSAIANLLGAQSSAQGTGANALASIIGSLTQAGGQQAQTALNAQQLGLNQTQGIFDSLNRLLGTTQQAGATAGQQQLGAAQIPSDFGRQLLQNLASIGGAQTGLFGQSGAQNFFNFGR